MMSAGPTPKRVTAVYFEVFTFDAYVNVEVLRLL